MSALTETLTLRVSPELRAALEAEAAEEKRKPADLHRLILEARLLPRAARRKGGRRG